MTPTPVPVWKYSGYAQHQARGTQAVCPTQWGLTVDLRQHPLIQYRTTGPEAVPSATWDLMGPETMPPHMVLGQGHQAGVFEAMLPAWRSSMGRGLARSRSHPIGVRSAESGSPAFSKYMWVVARA